MEVNEKNLIKREAEPPYLVSGLIESKEYANLILDCAVQVSVMQPQAVPAECYTGKQRRVTGVLGIPKSYPTANLTIQIGEQTAKMEVLVGRQDSNMLIGRDLPFFNDVLVETASRRREAAAVQLVSTRAQSRRLAEQEIQDDRDSQNSGATPTPPTDDKNDEDPNPGLDLFNDSLFSTPREPRQKKIKSQKRLHAKTFQITSRPEDPMESISREDLKKAQTEDQTLSTLWDQAKSEADSQFVINNGILLHTSQTLEGETFTQVVVPTQYR